MPTYRMTPARKAALKKAQLASARKRKGHGKAKMSTSGKGRAVARSTSGKGRVATRSGAVKSRGNASVNARKRRLKVAKRVAIGATAVGAAAGAAYVYKNREKMIIAPYAEHNAISTAKKAAKRQGKKLSKSDIHAVRMQERSDHAQRSTFRVREYKQARDMYRQMSKKGLNLRPQQAVRISRIDKAILAATGNSRSARDIGSKNTAYGAAGGLKAIGVNSQQYWYATYRKDVNARAQARLDRIKGGKKTFGYKSGKTKKVIGGRVYRMPF